MFKIMKPKNGEIKMDEYINSLVLAYFKSNQDDYSFHTLAKMLGLTVENLEEYIDNHIKNGNLKYINNMLKLTSTGRLAIMNDSVDYFDFEEDSIRIDAIDSASAWPVDKPYLPEKFTSKL